MALLFMQFDSVSKIQRCLFNSALMFVVVTKQASELRGGVKVQAASEL